MMEINYKFYSLVFLILNNESETNKIKTSKKNK